MGTRTLAEGACSPFGRWGRSGEGVSVAGTSGRLRVRPAHNYPARPLRWGVPTPAPRWAFTVHSGAGRLHPTDPVALHARLRRGLVPFLTCCMLSPRVASPPPSSSPSSRHGSSAGELVGSGRHGQGIHEPVFLEGERGRVSSKYASGAGPSSWSIRKRKGLERKKLLWILDLSLGETDVTPPAQAWGRGIARE